MISRNSFIILPKGWTPTKYPMFLPFSCWRRTTSEERVVLDTLFPKILALVSIVEVKLNRVFVIALKKMKNQISILRYFNNWVRIFFTHENLGSYIQLLHKWGAMSQCGNFKIIKPIGFFHKYRFHIKFPNWE